MDITALPDNSGRSSTKCELASWPEHFHHVTCCQRSWGYKTQADVNTFTFHFLNTADQAKFHFTYWATFQVGGGGLREAEESVRIQVSYLQKQTGVAYSGFQNQSFPKLAKSFEGSSTNPRVSRCFLQRAR